MPDQAEPVVVGHLVEVSEFLFPAPTDEVVPGLADEYGAVDSYGTQDLRACRLYEPADLPSWRALPGLVGVVCIDDLAEGSEILWFSAEPETGLRKCSSLGFVFSVRSVRLIETGHQLY